MQLTIENQNGNAISEFDPSTLKNHIAKKTQRGRKSKCPLPKDPRCQICLQYEDETESLMVCSICKCSLHPSCYHKPITASPAEFTCERCEEAITNHCEISSYKCFICSEGDGVLRKNKITGEFYHNLCFRLIPELFEDYKDESDICRINIRKWRYKNSCKYCMQKLDKNKAVIKCSNPKCKDYYHIPCAIEKGMLFDINYLYSYHNFSAYKDQVSVPFFCSCHNKRLAAAYRREVVFKSNAKPKEDSKRKMSMTSEESTNDLLTHSSDVLTHSSEDEYQGFFDDYSSNNILDLNFNQILIDESNAGETGIDIDFINASPKENIPFEFAYSNY